MTSPLGGAAKGTPASRRLLNFPSLACATAARARAQLAFECEITKEREEQAPIIILYPIIYIEKVIKRSWPELD